MNDGVALLLVGGFLVLWHAIMYTAVAISKPTSITSGFRLWSEFIRYGGWVLLFGGGVWAVVS